MKTWKTLVFGVLFLTACSKALSLIHPVALLFQPDEVFRTKMFYTVASASVVEFALCAMLFVLDDIKILWLVFAFAAAIIGYRFFVQINGSGRCPCLGNVTDWWPWLGKHENGVLTSVAVWLLLTSGFQLFMARSGND